MKIRLLPRECRRAAFYISFPNRLKFRVYKIECFFSTVGVSWVIVFHISFRDRKRFNALARKDGFQNFYYLSDLLENEVKTFLHKFRQYGYCKL